MFDIQAKDAGIRSIFWEQLHELKVVLEKEMGTDGIWLQGTKSDVVLEFDRIYWELAPIDSREVTNHQQIYSFFADRLIHFDAFYQEFKDILIHLAS